MGGHSIWASGIELKECQADLQHSRHRQGDNRRRDVLQVLLATSLTLLEIHIMIYSTFLWLVEQL